MLNKKIKSASIVVIGNEILTGRTQDKNINYIAKEFFKNGISLKYVCVIPDDKKTIVNEIRRLKKRFDFIIWFFLLSAFVGTLLWIIFFRFSKFDIF